MLPARIGEAVASTSRQSGGSDGHDHEHDHGNRQNTIIWPWAIRSTTFEPEDPASRTGSDLGLENSRTSEFVLQSVTSSAAKTTSLDLTIVGIEQTLVVAVSTTHTPS